MLLNYATMKFIKSNHEYSYIANSLWQSYIAVSQTDSNCWYSGNRPCVRLLYVMLLRATHVTFRYLILLSA